jgi:hypothetical protein
MTRESRRLAGILLIVLPSGHLMGRRRPGPALCEDRDAVFVFL